MFVCDCRLSKTKVNDMMRAVSVLRTLLKTGHVIELKKGLWMASHKKPGQMHGKLVEHSTVSYLQIDMERGLNNR